MSHHDYNIGNAPGAAVRADINNVLDAIVTLNSGDTAPDETYPLMLWADTANGLLKQRNAANNDWITIGKLGQAFLALLSLATGQTITAQHTFNPEAPDAPFVLGGNAQGQFVSGLNADKLDGKHATEIIPADGSVSQAKLKTSTGSWEISIPPNSASVTTMVDYCFFPKQWASWTESIYAWYSYYLSTTDYYSLGAYNNTASPITWYGSYRYVASSEQIIEAYRNDQGEVVAVHVTEKGNHDSVKFFGKDGNSLPMKAEILDSKSHPDLFEKLQCKKDAIAIHQLFKEKKVKNGKPLEDYKRGL